MQEVATADLLFGPEIIVRATGQPHMKSYEYTVGVIEAYGSFELIVETDPASSTPASASVWFDGQQVLTPSDFSGHPVHYRLGVSASEAGTFEIMLAGEPGSALQVTLVGYFKAGYGRIGPSGGELVHPDGLRYTVPEGALEEGFVVEVEKLEGSLDADATYVSPLFAIRYHPPDVPAFASTSGAPAGASASVSALFSPFFFKVLPHLIHINVPGLEPGELFQMEAILVDQEGIPTTAQLTGGPVLHPAVTTVDPVNDEVVGTVNGARPFMPTMYLQVRAKDPPCNDDGLYQLLSQDSRTLGDIPVVYVHGWQPRLENCEDWKKFNPNMQGDELLNHLSNIYDDIAFHRYTYPTYNSVANAGAALAAELKTQFGGRSDIILLGHSMGGLAIRSALGHPGIESMVARVVTLGTPHHGSPLASPEWVRQTGADVALEDGCDYWTITQLASCYRGIAVGLGLTLTNLETQGAKDLRPTHLGGNFVGLLPEPAHSERIHVFAGQLQIPSDLEPCGAGLIACFSYALGMELFAVDGVLGDGAVSRPSAFGVAGANVHALDGVGYDHGELRTGAYEGTDVFSDPDPLLTKVARLIVELIPADHAEIRYDGDVRPSAATPAWSGTPNGIESIVGDPSAEDGFAYELQTRSGGWGLDAAQLAHMDNGRGWAVTARHLAIDNEGGSLTSRSFNDDSDHLRISDGHLLVMVDHRPGEVRVWSGNFSGSCAAHPQHCKTWSVPVGAYTTVRVSGQGQYFEASVNGSATWTGVHGGHTNPKLLAFGNSSSSSQILSHARWDYVEADLRGAAVMPPDPGCGLVTEGLVGCWLFEGDALDGSGHGHDGFVDGPTFEIDRHGAASSAIRFDGEDDEIIIPSSTALRSASYAVSLWIKTAIVPSGFQSPLFGSLYHHNSADGNGYHLELISDNFGTRAGMVAANQFTAPSVNHGGAASVPITDDAWHHVVVQWDQTETQIYVDGLLKGEQNLPCCGASPGPIRWAPPFPDFKIGFVAGAFDGGSFTHFAGMLDDVRVFERSLTQEEIALLAVQ